MIQLTPDEVAEALVARHNRIAAAVLARHNRRLLPTVLTGGTLLLWLVAVFLVVVVATNHNHDVLSTHPESKVVWVDAEGKPVHAFYHEGRELTPDKMAALTNERMYALAWTVLGLAATLLVTIAASLTTLALVHVSRRATLRQIHASLADISAQLADLRQRTAPPPV